MGRIFGKKKKQKEDTKPIEKPKPTVLHRCRNQNCNKLIPEENLQYEIVYITEPPSQYSICPHCQTRLETIDKGELKIGPETRKPIESTEGKVFNYDLTINPKLTIIKKMLTLLSEKDVHPEVSMKEDAEMHMLFSHEKDYSFENLVQKGWVKSYKKS